MLTCAEVLARKFPSHVSGQHYDVSESGEDVLPAVWSVPGPPPTAAHMARWREELAEEDVRVAREELLSALLQVGPAAILNANQGSVGPAGADGATGPAGAQGIQGPQGTPGVATFATGGNIGASATPATTGVQTVPMDSAVKTITPTGACTFNASGGVAGQLCTFAITTAGASSFVMTWGTNFRRAGTLATGTTAARSFSVTFRCVNGTIWQEIGRTGALT